MVMMRLIVALTILLLGGRIAEFQTPPFGNRSNLAPLQSACRALLGVLSGPVLERLGGTLLFSPQVDGGGDGGGGDGGGGDGDGGDGAGTSGGGDGNGGAGTSSDGSTGGDSGTGEGNSGDSDSNGDGPGADPGAVGAPGDQGDPGSTEDAPANEAEAPPDPSAVTNRIRLQFLRRCARTYLRMILHLVFGVQVLLVPSTENSWRSSASPIGASPFPLSSGFASGPAWMWVLMRLS